MKKTLLITLIIAATTAITTQAAINAGTVKIYLNPGHGSWGPNDRPMPTIPYPNLSSTGRPDTCGFYESNTNMWKVYGLYDELIKMGVNPSNIKLSRWKNGPYPYTGEDYTYNKQLSVICAEVNSFGADMFLSVHSNAATDGTMTNYPLFLYRGTDANELVAGSKAMCNALWPHMKYNANEIDYYSRNATDIRGDITFYGSSSTTGYLGVLKHSSPGFLSEGYFHTYQPARHRALNLDYCKMEGVRYARGIRDYFSLNNTGKGYIIGTVKDLNKTLEHSLYHYKSGSIDAYRPINAATIQLYKDGVLVGTYKTDNNYNGVFNFKNLEPGSYTINAYAEGYSDLVNQSFTVVANKTTYPKLYMTEGQSSGGGGENPPPTEAVKRIYAYDLRDTKNDDGSYTFSFTANSDALAAEIIFSDSITGDNLGSVTLTDVKEGHNIHTLTQEQLPGEENATMNWAVKLTGKTVTAVAKLNSDDAVYNYTRACVAVDDSPESDYMGRFYVIDRTGASAATNGLWAYNADYSRINSTILRGSETFGNPYRLTTDDEGTIYIADWGDGHSGVFRASPGNLNGTFTQFFQGTRESNGTITNDGAQVGCSTTSVDVVGSGSSTRMFTFNEDFEPNNVAIYNIGQPDGNIATSWNTSPSGVFQVNSLMLNGNSQVVGDNKGGVWVSQRRVKDQNLATTPSLIHVNEAGNINFNSGNDLPSLNGSPQAGFAVNRDNTLLAIGDGDQNVQVYDITWNGSLPVLRPKTSFAGGVGDVQQMSFDYAGNLVVGGTSVKIYSIPLDDNVCTTPAKKSLTITKQSTTPPVYVILKDIDTYSDTLNIQLTSNWMRSVKNEYANITFESDGIFNRGMAVSGDKVYVTGRSSGTSSASCYLDVYDKHTGQYLQQLLLSSNAQVAYLPCNDIMTDDEGNVLISNLTLHINSSPLVIQNVDTISGNVATVASLTCNGLDARIDYCNVLGNVTTGNFTIMAATASNNKIVRWKFENGVPVSTITTTVTEFYPATATTFGIAPRIIPVDETHALVKGTATQLTLYNLDDGTIAQSFSTNTELASNTLNANGGATFTMDGMSCMVYPYNDHSSATGIQFALAVGDTPANTTLKLAHLFPSRGMGAVNSQTYSTPVAAELSDDGKSAYVFVYAPGNGLASYTITSLKQGTIAVLGDVNGDGECTGSDVTALYNYILYNDSSSIVNGDQNGDGQITGSDVTAVYNIILGL